MKNEETKLSSLNGITSTTIKNDITKPSNKTVHPKVKQLNMQRRNAKNQHRQQHKKSNVTRYRCPICSKLFLGNGTLRKHKLAIHPELFFKSSKCAGEDEVTFGTCVAYAMEKTS